MMFASSRERVSAQVTRGPSALDLSVMRVSAAPTARPQAKLVLGAPGDRFEREADAVADRVMREQDPALRPGGAGAVVQRKCASCAQEDEERVMAEPGPGGLAGGLSEAGASEIQSARGGGTSLDGSVRARLEPRFGYSFADVRVHADARAASLARGIGARAFTLGSDVFFGAGQYRPGSPAGQRLLAHELTHVVQQRGGSERVQRLGDPTKIPSTMRCPPATDSPPSVLLDVNFAQDSAVVEPSQIGVLESVVDNWNALGGTDRVRIDGYASTDGEQDYNWTLSCERAQAVADVLGATSSSGAQGIPSAFLEVLAQGETDEVAGGLSGNRKATVSMESQPAPTPTPTPPAFVCGPDVTSEVSAAVARTRSTFAGWSPADRDDHCGALDSLSTGAMAWDIVQLHNQDWIHLNYRPACASAGAVPACGSSVQVGSECYYAGSPNYVIYGTMCSLCHDHYAALGDTDGMDRFTQATMEYWINFYKGTGPIGVGTPSGNFGPSREWSIAGYRGWPGVTAPPGDRANCAPVCPTPLGHGPFRVYWHPTLF